MAIPPPLRLYVLQAPQTKPALRAAFLRAKGAKRRLSAAGLGRRLTTFFCGGSMQRIIP